MSVVRDFIFQSLMPKKLFFSGLNYNSNGERIWYLNLVVVSWNSVLILVLDLIFLWLMWKPHSDGSLISQFNRNIQKQRNGSSLTFCFLYRMKLNLRSNHSEYFSLKSTETYISTDNFRPRISVFDWLIFCSGNLMLYLNKSWKQ